MVEPLGVDPDPLSKARPDARKTSREPKPPREPESRGLPLLLAVPARREPSHDLGEIDPEERLRDRAPFGRGPDDRFGQLRSTRWVDHGEVVDVAERRRGFADDRRHER